MEFRATTTTTTATLTKKLSNGYGVSGRSAYDGVFATPIKLRAPSFSSQFEDYSEIFGGSGASSLGSSIPILELPELNEGRTVDDVRRSKLDYSKVFGGFGNLEASVPFEELVARPKENDSFTHEASKRSKVKSGNQSCWEDHTDRSKEIPAESQSSKDAKRINLSYHRVNQGSENGTNGTTHIAQLHAVPAYTCLIEEVNSVKTNRAKMSIPVAQDTYSGSHCNEGINGGGRRTKSFTGPSPDNVKKQFSNDGVKVKNRSDSIDLFYDAFEISNGSNSKSCSDPPDNAKKQSSSDRGKVKSISDSGDLFYDACEVSNESNGTHHNKVPPSETMAGKFDNHIGDAMRSVATECQTSKSGTSEGAAGADSPSYLDDMVHSNSAAAASVAALRKAIEEAQVRMKVAKESLRRKKERFPDRVKQKSNIDLKSGGEKEAKIASKTMKLEEINTRKTIREMDALLQVASEVGKPMTRIEQVRLDCGAEEMCVAKEAVREAPKKLKSSQAGHMKDVEQKEADHKGEVIELKEVDNTKKVLCVKQKGRNAAEKPEESEHTIEVVKECWGWEINEEKVHVDNEAGACEEPVNEIKHRYQEVVDDTKLIQETLDNETMDKRLMVNEDGEVGNKVTPFHEPKEYESNLGGQGLVVGNEIKVACKPEEDGLIVEGSFELEECQKKLRAIQELGEGEKNIAQEQEGSEDKAEVSSELEELELTEFLEPIDNESVCSPHGSDLINMKKEIEDLGCLEDRKRRNESSSLDINHETEHSCQREATDNTFRNVYVQEILEDTVDNIHDGEEIYEINTNDGELDGNGRVQDVQASDNEIKGGTQQIEQNERERKDKKMPVEVTRVTQNYLNHEEIKAKEAGNTTETISSYEPDETGKLNKTQVADTTFEDDETLKVTSEVYSCDVQDDTVVASNTSFQHEGALELNEPVNQMQNAFEKVTHEGAVTNNGETDMKGRQNKDQCVEGAVTNSGETEMKVRQNQDQCMEKAENGCNLAMRIEDTAPESAETCEDTNEARVVTNIGETDMKAWQNQDQCLEKVENDCNPAMLVEETTPESVDICSKDTKEARVALDDEIDENQSNTSDAEVLFDSEHNIEMSHMSHMSEWKSSPFSEEEVKSIQSNLKENHQESVAMEEKEANGNSKKVKLEKEHQKKIDEAKEREREREKEKLAVERAIREARERAFAEARERAALGRAAASRQRNISDGRERLGKTTSLANEKTPANEKAAMEAKLKAERAAVERATAEARARALERALSEKAASEARNKYDKSVGTSRDNGMKQNFHSKSFSYGEVRDSTDVFDGANGDSAQRCKARSERHQRIGERVAKALAEKNMRDWLVQKEQEERNRVAEALDADVKRWSSGKAGNLRALLSTLQYILGPDSGWQPIPLTDIVTTTAVRKAYRKATLFVHPDKLQQRGATIQQKFTCEKVFDLLKEAWNRFNMEER